MFVNSEILKISQMMKKASGKAFCPCSGNDLEFILSSVGIFVDRFVFCDVSYRARKVSVNKSTPASWKLSSSIYSRDMMKKLKSSSYLGGREFRPSAKLEIWQRPDAKDVLIEIRQDLAEEYLIDDCRENSISCFVHINDGAGEGGSSLWFLAKNKDPDTPGFLEELSLRLTDYAIIVTDGALTEKHFKQFSGFEIVGRSWKPICKLEGNKHHDREIMVWETEKLK